MGEADVAAKRTDAERVAELEARLGVRFADRVRALAALTHKSWVNEHRDEVGEDNERLEFLGDAVVDLLASHRLMDRFPVAREGPLSKMRAAVVDEPGLAAMARSLGLGELLRLGRGEEMTGGREKASLLANSMEAVVAAVYLEGGLALAQEVVDRFLEEAVRQATAGTLDRDYKTQLQEGCQARFRSPPRYRVVAETGPDHSKVFDVEVEVRGAVLGRGSGRSKKDAEQLAARQALEALSSAGGGAVLLAAFPAPTPSAAEPAEEPAAPPAEPSAPAPVPVPAPPGPPAAPAPPAPAVIPPAVAAAEGAAPTAPRRRASRKVKLQPAPRPGAGRKARATGKGKGAPRKAAPRKKSRR